MSYLNRDELRTHIGKIGIFFNEESENTIKIGRLTSVTKNGNCEDEDSVYYDEFKPLTMDEIVELLYTKLPLKKPSNAFGVIKEYSVGDVIAWKGKNNKHILIISKIIDKCSIIENNYLINAVGGVTSIPVKEMRLATDNEKYFLIGKPFILQNIK